MTGTVRAVVLFLTGAAWAATGYWVIQAPGGDSIGSLATATVALVPQFIPYVRLLRQRKTKRVEAPLFVDGLKQAVQFTQEELNKGFEYRYLCGRSFKIVCRQGQNGLELIAVNENKRRYYLDVNLGASEELELIHDIYIGAAPGVYYLIGQYDFDADGIDELVFAIRYEDESDNALFFNVYQLEDDRWRTLGSFSAGFVLGSPKAQVKLNHIEVKRNLRDGRWIWTYHDGRFEELADF